MTDELILLSELLKPSNDHIKQAHCSEPTIQKVLSSSESSFQPDRNDGMMQEAVLQMHQLKFFQSQICDTLSCLMRGAMCHNRLGGGAQEFKVVHL